MEDDLFTTLRRRLVARINESSMEREALERRYGKVYDTKELQEHFTVRSFAAPFCMVTEMATGKDGALMFQHMPRFYFDFTEV